MQSEDLFVSAREINVRYRFFNKSDREHHAARRVPDAGYHSRRPRREHLGADRGPGKPPRLHDDRERQAGRHQGRAARDGARSRPHGACCARWAVPLAPHLITTNEALDRLPRDNWDEFVRLGLAEIEEYDAGQGMQKHLAARWTLQTTFYWEQIFPAQAETVIEHRYKPSVGASVQTALGSPNESKEPWYEDYKDKYCFDYEFLAAVERARRAVNSKSARPTASSASTISSRPAPTGPGRSRSSVWWSTRARRTTSSPSAARM